MLRGGIPSSRSRVSHLETDVIELLLCEKDVPGQQGASSEDYEDKPHDVESVGIEPGQSNYASRG